ncbi:hypothetical protein HW450_05630 [Corynebacterium hindlerae]|uniref:Uncharacterized protein n=1 Tax=Corynebacterium hindlerae TaxID=699041 RepID=A0A7G5FHV2_9CORY|nr:DUF5819 family protein [Corynebacterium hindlerae]QMV86193.1 hypothetical protein HW450_05630 [Corynebacterium hindlerae]
MTYNLPDSHMRNQLITVDNIIDPVFTQRWTLFAPDAPVSDVGILAKYESEDEQKEFTNLTSPEIAQSREGIIPRKSTREMNSLAQSYISSEETVLSKTSNATVPPFAFLATNEQVTQVSEEIKESHPLLVESLAKDNERLALAALERLGGNELKKRCHEDGGTITIRLVAVPIPGLDNQREKPGIRTLKPLTCGVDFDAIK